MKRVVIGKYIQIWLCFTTALAAFEILKTISPSSWSSNNSLVSISHPLIYASPSHNAGMSRQTTRNGRRYMCAYTCCGSHRGHPLYRSTLWGARKLHLSVRFGKCSRNIIHVFLTLCGSWRIIRDSVLQGIWRIEKWYAFMWRRCASSGKAIRGCISLPRNIFHMRIKFCVHLDMLGSK